MSSPQHEAQYAAGDHGDDGQRQQPVPLQATPHVTPQVLRPLEESLDPVPHLPLCSCRSMRALVRALFLLAAR